MIISLTHKLFRFKKGLSLLAVLLSFSAEALDLCRLQVALPGQVAVRLNSFSLTLAAKRRSGSDGGSLSRGEKDQVLQKIKDAYRGVLQDSLEAQIIGKAELAQLTESRGRVVQSPTSGSLVLTTQEAIDRLLQYATESGLSPDRVENAFAEILGELFPIEAKKEPGSAPNKRNVPKLFLPSLETGTDGSQRNLRLLFPAHQDEVFASNAKGEIYRLQLFDSTVRIQPEWELVFKAKPQASGEPLLFDVSRDGSLLAVDEQDALTLYDLRQGRRLWSVPGQPKKRVVLSPTGERVACLAENSPVLLFEVTTGIARELRFKKNGRHGSNGYSLTTTDKWEKNLFESVSFSEKGDRIFLEGAWPLNVEIDLTKKWLSAAATFGNFSGPSFWGEFADGRRVYTFAGTNYIEKDGSLWEFQRGYRFNFGHLVSHPKTRNIYLSAPLWGVPRPCFVSIFELASSSPSIQEVITFDAVNAPETVRGLELSRNGRLLAAQSEKATYFWNVQDAENPVLIVRVAEIFRDLPHSKAAGFSGSGKYFTGVSSKGKLLTLDLSQHKNWPRPSPP